MGLKPEQTQNVHLQDMLTSARKAASYVEGMTFEQFWENEKTRDAVALRLAVIGEAARHITDATATALPKIPFHQIRGMRHRIAHDYNSINFKTVWQVVTEELPSLISELEKYLQRQKHELEAKVNPPSAIEPPPPRHGPSMGM